MSTSFPQGYRRIAAGRYREVVGLGYDELTVGLVIEHRPGRTLTEADNVLMTTLGGNDAPIHTDAHYSSRTEWGRPLVCSSVTLHIVGGMTVRSTSGLTVANLGFEEIRFTHPVFVGDTLYAETEITGRRMSNSRPCTGIITCRTTGRNQNDDIVMTFSRSFLLPRDSNTVRNHTNY
ncbi:MaoC family dehydratase [Streptomyces sp. NPDC056503]|uniref:MaoC family dehydratase n=1 Tax=Streptomyces sp. NPDC056503 TaxID=3345842 RepID=UPI0036B8F770